MQGESPTSAQGSEHAAGPHSMSQCFYRLPTFAKSINLEVVRAAEGADAGALKECGREREEQLERERAAGQVREGGHEEEEVDKEEDSRPQRVQGLGAEAYLTANERTSTLYVLKGEAVLRLSVSGKEERPARLKKATALAAKALRRL